MSRCVCLLACVVVMVWLRGAMGGLRGGGVFMCVCMCGVRGENEPRL